MKNFRRGLLILFSILVLASCGVEKESNSSSEIPSVTIFFEESDTVDRIKGEKKMTEEIVTVKRETTTSKNEDSEIETTSARPEQSEVATTTTTTVEEFIVYKPSTHYVHKSTCDWVDGTCKQIKNTKGIEARLCTDCNPKIKIYQEYKEPVTTTVTTTAAALTTTALTTTAAATKKTGPVIESTTTKKIFEEKEKETTTKATTTKKEVKEEEETKETKKAKTTTTTTAKEEEKEIEEDSSYRLPYQLSDDDWFMICKVVSSETGYCDEHIQKAVANTIFNRIIWASKYGNNNPFPTSVYGILHQPNQYNAINYWRSDKRLQPGGSLWNKTMRIIKAAASEPDFTNGAIGYYNPNMSGYLSAFENNRGLVFTYQDSAGRFFKLNAAYYS